jgi:osmoprotectant transport system substrate-binding protein
VADTLAAGVFRARPSIQTSHFRIKEDPVRKTRMTAVGAVLLALILSACGPGDGSASSSPSAGASVTLPAVIMGANNWSESQVVAEIWAQALEAQGFTVTRQLDFASRDVSYPALADGEVNIMPEYLGSLTRFLGGEATSERGATAMVLGDLLEADGLTFFDLAPGVDADGFAVRAETADQFQLVTMTDAAAVADQLTWGLPPECPTNPTCGPGLLSVYGIDISAITTENLAPCSAEMANALNLGGIDVAELCTTQAAIEQFNFVLLEDDGGLAPAQNIIPVLSQDLADAGGQDMADVINAISALLTTAELTRLQYEIDINHQSVDDVASTFLTDNGL